MNENIGTQIRNTLGTIQVFYIEEDGSSWGNVLRLYIEMDLHKPLSRGKTINVHGNQSWMPITYEKLPKLCFRCGRITHERAACSGIDGTSESPFGQFGPWLRANVDHHYEKNKKPFGPSPSSSTKPLAASRVKHNTPALLLTTAAADQTPMGLGGKPKSSLANLGEKQRSFAVHTVVEPNGERVTKSNLQEISASTNGYMMTKEATDSHVVGMGYGQEEVTSPLKNPRPNYVPLTNCPTMDCETITGLSTKGPKEDQVTQPTP